MKNAPCNRCSKKFSEKDIYTIQQFQYRQEPNYEWTKEFLNNLEVGEWDSLCEQCMKFYAETSMSAWKKCSKR
ncbi:MAG: hypothetical protein K5793_08710 [Nitrosarchaeum sp.]|nr:hypothetical protein [Nitrosarchaeum sp.]MCV0399123.1 hypothetical protein [Nitrosarchaeum sp.]